MAEGNWKRKIAMLGAGLGLAGLVGRGIVRESSGEDTSIKETSDLVDKPQASDDLDKNPENTMTSLARDNPADVLNVPTKSSSKEDAGSATGLSWEDLRGHVEADVKKREFIQGLDASQFSAYLNREMMMRKMRDYLTGTGAHDIKSPYLIYGEDDKYQLDTFTINYKKEDGGTIFISCKLYPEVILLTNPLTGSSLEINKDELEKVQNFIQKESQ